jgi:hypothetical protein
VLDINLILDMPLEEFATWQAYYEIDPFGEDRADLRAGIVASVIANANRDPKRKPTPFTAQDFMPLVRESQRAQQRKPLSTQAQWGGFVRTMKMYEDEPK